MDIVFAVNERFTHLACCVNMEKDPSSLKDFTAVSENRSKNQLRPEIREACIVSEHILKSNQTSDAKDNLRLLNNYICKLVEQNICDSDVNRKSHLYHLKGLRAVLEMMVAKVPSKHPNKDITISFISFHEAFDLFLGHTPEVSILQQGTRHLRKRFMELLCHPKFGLSVYIIYDRFIVLKSNDVDLQLFLGAFIEYMEQKNECKDASLDLNLETVTELIESMDTEWDKRW